MSAFPRVLLIDENSGDRDSMFIACKYPLQTTLYSKPQQVSPVWLSVNSIHLIA